MIGIQQKVSHLPLAADANGGIKFFEFSLKLLPQRQQFFLA